MQSIEEIVCRLADLGVPSNLVSQHALRVTKWRKDHPRRIKRKRLYDDELRRAFHQAAQETEAATPDGICRFPVRLTDERE